MEGESTLIAMLMFRTFKDYYWKDDEKLFLHDGILIKIQSLQGAHSFFSSVPGDTLGSCVYVPCEVMKQRMQIQGTRKSWSSIILKENISQKSGQQMYGYYSGMFQAGHSILKQHGLKGLYAGYVVKSNLLYSFQGTIMKQIV